MGGVQDSTGKKKISLDAAFTFELGQIVKGRYGEQAEPETFRHLWLDNICGAVDIKGKPFNWLELITGFEGRMWYNTFPTEATLFEFGAHDMYWEFYLTQAQAKFSFLKDRPLSLDMSFGYFPYKYNPEARVLGEYLFRTGTYPVFIVNKFDSPLARLGGLCISLNYNNDLLGIRFDQLIISEREYRPLHDFTLASIIDVNIAKFFDLGVGVSFAHLLPVDKEFTSPVNFETVIKQEKIVGSDTITDTLGYYTFKATKLMFRGTIDPFVTMREKSGFIGDFFGDYGGKLYAEVAFIGFKNYDEVILLDTIFTPNSNPYGYKTIKERMPIAVGLTIPGWKIFDILAIELEYFDCPYPNSYKKVFQDGNPLPTVPTKNPESDYNKKAYDEEKLKWMVYIKKNISENFSAMLQIGRDNMRWEVNGAHGPNFDFEDALVKKDHWAWRFKTTFMF